MKVRKFSISSVLRQSLNAVPHKGTTSLEWKSEKRSKSPLKIIPFWWMDGRDEKGNLSVWISIGDLRVISQTVHTHIFGFFFSRFWAQGKELCWCFRFTSNFYFSMCFKSISANWNPQRLHSPAVGALFISFVKVKQTKILGAFLLGGINGKVYVERLLFLGSIQKSHFIFFLSETI